MNMALHMSGDWHCEYGAQREVAGQARAGTFSASTSRWCMDTRMLTVILPNKAAHRAGECRIGGLRALTVAWQAHLRPCRNHAVQVQRTAPSPDRNGKISCDELTQL